MKKIISIISAAVIAVSVFAFVGCKGQETTEISKGDGSGGKLLITTAEAGFGTDWAREMAIVFSATYNVDVSFAENRNSGELISYIESGQSKFDVVMPMSNAVFKVADQNKLVDLSDVYKTTPEGESEPISKKVNQNTYNMLLNEDDTVYAMPWSSPITGIFYNKNTLDTLFPENEGGYTLPRTTDELIEFSQKVVATGEAYAFSMTTSQNYWDYMLFPWAAQYSGNDAFVDYFNLLYTNSAGEKVLAETYNDIKPASRLKALEVIEAIIGKGSGLVHQYAERMDYIDAQNAFAGQPFEGDTKMCAFIVSGSWMENELQPALSVKWQDIGMMKTPVISSILETLKDKSIPNTDEGEQILRKVIDQVDAGKSWEEAKEADTALQNVSKDDYERIADARTYLFANTLDHLAVIPKTAKNLDNAKKFLVFMASDAGQQIYAKHLNGLSQGYGYEADLSDSSLFVKSVTEITNSGYTNTVQDNRSPYVYNGGFRFQANDNRYSLMVKGQIDAESLNSSIDTYWTQKFKDVKDSAIN